MEINGRIKQTEIAMIPEDWDCKKLGDLFSLQQGFSFSSLYFSEDGPILLTPGNFKLSGGLYFNKNNTKRYSGFYKKSLEFKKGDLLIVMTDLTSECNLLGKPAFVDIDEIVLHNQRIGKVVLFGNIHLNFLFYLLLNKSYLNNIKSTATGTTVRHTSNKNIYQVFVPVPPISEQRAIAEALSDVDALIAAQEALIAKKRAIKQGVMQELLTGKRRLPGFNGEWKEKSIGELLDYEQPTKYIVNSTEYAPNNEVPVLTANKSFILGYTDESHGIFENVPVIIFDDFTTDKKYVNFPFKVKSSGMKILRQKHKFVDLRFVYEKMQLIDFVIGDHKRYYISEYQHIKVSIPVITEQNAISAIITTIETEITTLEKKLEKIKLLKQGMMQELLTGRIRLM